MAATNIQGTYEAVVVIPGAFAVQDRVKGLFNQPVPIEVRDMTDCVITRPHIPGKTWDFKFTVTDASGSPVSLQNDDLSYAIISMSLSLTQDPADENSALYGKKTSPHADITIADQTAETGVVTVHWTPIETAAVEVTSFGRIWFELNVKFDTAREDIVARGWLAVETSIL